MQQPVAASISSTRHGSALGTWERVWQRPSRPLRGLISGYVGYRQRLATPVSHRGIPSPTLPLVISFGPPQTVALPHTAQPAVTVGSFLSGMHDRYVLIDADGYDGIQVDLAPVAAYRLLGQPLRGLTGHVVPLDALLGVDANRLIDDLASAPDWPARFRRLDRYLADRMLAGDAPVSEVVRSWERILASRGQVRVGDLAAEVGWSQRHLATRFGDSLGLSPKRMARLARFDHAKALLAGPGTRGLADVAARAGYYDQAHLTNDVREYSGLSPTRLLARQLPDGGGVFELEGS
jgi:AraC-like DNA-binding protein